MKLISSNPKNIWVIVDEVSDNDAAVLRSCGFQYGYDVDENGNNREDGDKYTYEIWYNTNRCRIIFKVLLIGHKQ